MKIRTLIPAIIALVILVGGPFGFGRSCDSDPRGGLVCYCCTEAGSGCAMLSCSGCCGAHGGAAVAGGSPEMLLESSPATTPLQVAATGGEAVRMPQTVYLDIPHEPPDHA